MVFVTLFDFLLLTQPRTDLHCLALLLLFILQMFSWIAVLSFTYGIGL